jgi:Glycosyl hydrolase catalytic core
MNYSCSQCEQVVTDGGRQLVCSVCRMLKHTCTHRHAGLFAKGQRLKTSAPITHRFARGWVVSALLLLSCAAHGSEAGPPSGGAPTGGAPTGGGATAFAGGGATAGSLGGPVTPGSNDNGGGSSNASLGGGGTTGTGSGGISISAGATGQAESGSGGSVTAGGSGGTATAGGSGGNAGVAGSAGAAPVSARYKGLAFAEAHCEDLETLGASWYYTWNSTTGCSSPTAEFVPQVWGNWETLSWVETPAQVRAAGNGAVIGFNEPDHVDQANMDVATVLRLWPEFDQPGLRVGSPGPAGDGRKYFESFMAGVDSQALRVDFVAMHWYGWNAGSCNNVAGLEDQIVWAEKFKRPIWLTEFGCRLQSAEVTRAFFNDAIAMFARHPLVERYAWYLSRSEGDFANGALIDANGNLTPLGKDFTLKPATRQ